MKPYEVFTVLLISISADNSRIAVSTLVRVAYCINTVYKGLKLVDL